MMMMMKQKKGEMAIAEITAETRRLEYV